MLHCNGKCQLAKKLRQAEKKEQQNSGLRFDNIANEVIFSPTVTYNFYCPSLLVTYFDYFQDNHLVDFPVSIFHPPCFNLVYS